MKMLKKLMAVALAGALALTILTGCGASYNKKELIAELDDVYKLIYGTEMHFTDAGKSQANKVITLIQEAYEKTDADKKADFDPMQALNVEDVKKSLEIKDDTEDYYTFGVARIQKYNSKYNQEHSTSKLMLELMQNSKALSEGASSCRYSSTGTVSLNTVTVGGVEYLVAVIKVNA